MSAKKTNPSSSKSIPTVIHGYPGKPNTTGTVNIAIFSSEERLKRSLKILGMCWGIAILCVPIPLIHFTVLPAALIAGVVLFFRTLKQESLVTGGQGTCPECGKIFTVGKATNKFPLNEMCEHCQTSVEIKI